MTSERKLQTVEEIVRLLDNRFKLGPIKFGLDPIIGFVPVVGDIIPAALSLYLISIAIEEQLDPKIISRMVFNTVADFAIGSIPVIGDVSDFFYKSHLKNLKLLKEGLQFSSPVIPLQSRNI